MIKIHNEKIAWVVFWYCAAIIAGSVVYIAHHRKTMFKFIFSMMATHEFSLGAQLTLGGKNMFGCNIYTLEVSVPFRVITMGILFQKRF